MRRVDQHNKGKGAKYTRGRRPVKLLAIRKGLTQKGAAMLEYMVKQKRKDDKVPFLLGFAKPLPTC
jgi:putative endonuclease